MRVSLAGSGNVATHLGAALKNAGHVIGEVWSRTPESAALLAYHLKAAVADSASHLGHRADLVVIAVNDDAIPAVAAKIRVKGMVAHTSGSTGLATIIGCSEHTGVIYPLQTFSKFREVDFKKVPVAVEGNTRETTAALIQLASAISDHVTAVDSEKRLGLHVAAVFAGNFTNHLYGIAGSILRDLDLDFDLIRPLIMETAGKVMENMPAAAQTGPAIRNDKAIMARHLDFLKNDPQLSVLYKELSERIINFDRRLRG